MQAQEKGENRGHKPHAVGVEEDVGGFHGGLRQFACIVGFFRNGADIEQMFY
jgi:hypothetical protein